MLKQPCEKFFVLMLFCCPLCWLNVEPCVVKQEICLLHACLQGTEQTRNRLVHPAGRPINN